MIPIPAIDLKDGKVVRLLRGSFAEEKVYADDALAVAMRYEREGAARIHIVDLDGALRGEPRNTRSVEKILSRVKIPIQLGGGIRSIEAAERFFEMGVRWAILGTQVCLDRGFMKEALGEFKDRIIIGLDAQEGCLATDGWTKITAIRAGDFAKEVEAVGGKTVIYTDISRDGSLLGPNLSQIKVLSEGVKIDIIASGGVSSLKDLLALTAIGRDNIIGAIIGKALYENKFSLQDAIRTCLQKG